MEEMEEVQPPSRPLTPTEQLTIMKTIETEESQLVGKPTERDLDVSRFYKTGL